MVRKTRNKTRTKATGKGKGMTIPQLRRAFDHIDSFVARGGKNLEAFRKEWKHTFGKEVSAKAAREYLDFVSSKRTTKSQKGGMAPLHYDMRQGADIPYGSFPPYVSSGFGFANQDSFASGCGKEDISPHLPAGLGSNMVGGKKSKTRKHKKQRGGAFSLQNMGSQLADFVNRPITMASPPSSLNHAMMDSKGYNGFPSPHPEDPSFKFPQNTPIYAGYLSRSSVQV